MELTREITDLYSTWVWVRVRKSFITSTSWVRVWFGARSTIWSTSSCSRKFYNLGAWSTCIRLNCRKFIWMWIICNKYQPTFSYSYLYSFSRSSALKEDNSRDVCSLHLLLSTNTNNSILMFLQPSHTTERIKNKTYMY